LKTSEAGPTPAWGSTPQLPANMELTKFELDEDEQKKLNKWFKKKDSKKYSGAIGGRYTYSFTPTSLGVCVRVRDDLDKDEIDLTDYLSW